MKIQIVLFASVIVWLGASDALPCRPMATEDCGTTPAGKPSVECGLGCCNIGASNTSSTFCGVLTYGLTANWDIGIEIPYAYNEASNGPGDMVLKSKYLVMKESASRPAFLLKPTLKLPSGNEDKGLGSGKPDAGLLAVFTKGFGAVTGHFNAGYYASDLTKDEAWKGNSGILAAGVLIPLDKKFTLATELIYEPTFNSDASDNSFDNLTGIIWAVNERTAYDFGFRFDLEDTAEYQLIAGVSIGF